MNRHLFSSLLSSLSIAPLTTLIVVALVGCQKQQLSAPDAESQVASAPDAGDSLVDRLQREVRVETPAQRIVSLSPATTELLFAIELGEQVVGVTKNCNFPPQALDLPRVGGGTIESISSEAILALKPDLVLCKWDSHQPLIETLERLDVKVCAIGAQSLEELYEESDWVGRLTDRKKQAQELISQMRARHGKLMEIVSKFEQEPKLRVFYEVWDEPLMTAAPNSFIGELLTMAGLENVLSDTSVRYPRISSETVVARDPQVILAPTSHFEKVDVNAFQSRPGWSAVSAVAKQRIYLISGDEVSRCGPRVLNALAEIIVAAYPNAQELVSQSINESEVTSESGGTP
ncbi:MAG: helical backbone metal receptor [Planctomycetota bacterium]